MKILTMAVITMVVLVGGFVWVSEDTNLDNLSEFVVKWVSLGSGMPYTEPTNREFKVAHDRAVYLVKSNDVAYTEVTFAPSSTDETIGYMIFELNNGVSREAIDKAITSLKDEQYTVIETIDEGTQTAQLYITIDLDILRPNESIQ